MTYLERKVRSAPGLSQEEALESLQSHPNFRPGSKIASLRRRGDRWVAVLHVPKVAGEFPPDDGGEGPPKKPKKDDGDDGGDVPDDGGDDLGSLPDGPEGLPGEPGGDKLPGEGGPEAEILHVLTEILHALKGGPVGPGMGGPDDMGPGPDAMGGPPPPHGGPPPPPHGAPPGGMPPGMPPGKPKPPMPLPVGGPAFSKTSPLYARIAKVAGRQRHIPVSSPQGMTIGQAKAELEPVAHHFGYKVAQIRYCGPSCTCKAAGSSKIHALLEHNG